MLNASAATMANATLLTQYLIVTMKIRTPDVEISSSGRDLISLNFGDLVNVRDKERARGLGPENPSLSLPFSLKKNPVLRPPEFQKATLFIL